MDRPLMVFAGRSNVGKSSTIRLLTGRKVRVGKRPGSTKWEIMIDLGSVTLVDVPGFGYMAGASKTAIEGMKTTLIQKLEGWSDRLAIAVLIVDISLFRTLVDRWENRGEIPIDVEFYTFLSEISTRVIVVANKMDKLKKREQPVEMEYLAMKLKEALPEEEPFIVPFSASKKTGVTDLKRVIEDTLQLEGIEKPRW
ncbi:MAG: GTP-binding protein EngB [Candidatus Thorarchaeota archaeon]|nr:MAG: GTP-binding protein EngB [Candidatus Thorarchaeota archaeon]